MTANILDYCPKLRTLVFSQVPRTNYRTNNYFDLLSHQEDAENTIINTSNTTDINAVNENNGSVIVTVSLLYLAEGNLGNISEMQLEF